MPVAMAPRLALLAFNALLSSPVFTIQQRSCACPRGSTSEHCVVSSWAGTPLLSCSAAAAVEASTKQAPKTHQNRNCCAPKPVQSVSL